MTASDDRELWRLYYDLQHYLERDFFDSVMAFADVAYYGSLDQKDRRGNLLADLAKVSNMVNKMSVIVEGVNPSSTIGLESRHTASTAI
jgi:hypothetical protein